MPNPKLVIACPEECSLHPSKIGQGVAEVLLLMRENGAGSGTIAKRAAELLKRPVPTSNAARHVKHYKEVEERPGGYVDPAKKLADLEILDLVIQRGAQNSANWKPTIKDTIEAMKLKTQMTGNSAFDDLISLFDGDEADSAMDEAEEALLAPGERPPKDDPDDFDLPEPAF